MENWEKLENAKKNLDRVKLIVRSKISPLEELAEILMPAFQPFVIEGYKITPRRSLSALRVIDVFEEIMKGNYIKEGYGEAANLLEGLEHHVPKLSAYLLYHLGTGSTPELNKCEFIDVDENPRNSLESISVARLMNLENIFLKIKEEHEYKIRTQYSRNPPQH